MAHNRGPPKKKQRDPKRGIPSFWPAPFSPGFLSGHASFREQFLTIRQTSLALPHLSPPPQQQQEHSTIRHIFFANLPRA